MCRNLLTLRCSLWYLIYILYFHSSVHKVAKRRIYRRKREGKAMRKQNIIFVQTLHPAQRQPVSKPVQPSVKIISRKPNKTKKKKKLNESKIQSKATARRRGTSHGLEEDATKVTQMISRSAENGIAEGIVDPRSRDRVGSGHTFDVKGSEENIRCRRKIGAGVKLALICGQLKGALQ
jgi:hypothetical protein